jgi:hypothetical protein
MSTQHVGRIGAQRVRAKRGPMTGSGVIRHSPAIKRWVTPSAFALELRRTSWLTHPVPFGLMQIRLLLRVVATERRNDCRDL